jgi:hypothetical protein
VLDSGGILKQLFYNDTTRQLSRGAAASGTLGQYWGASTVVSAHGSTGSGLVWFESNLFGAVCNPTTGVPLTLVAVNMQNIASGARWTVGQWTDTNCGGGVNASPMIAPIVMDGRVFAPYSGGVAAFGL